MKTEQREFIELSRLPAVLTAEEVSRLIGFRDDELILLIKAGLVPPLPGPDENGKPPALLENESHYEP